MRLVPDPIDAQSAGLQVFDEPDYPRALGWLLEVVVVVVELGAGISLAGELEGLRDLVVADAVAPRRLEQ